MAITPVLRRTAIATITAFVVVMMLLPSSATESPWIEVIEPEDGGWVTDPDLQVSGNATPPTIIDRLEKDFLSNGTGFGFVMEGGNLTLRPREIFSDDFSGTELDTTKWEVQRHEAGISFTGDHLMMTNTVRNFPLINSIGATFPSDADWMARFQMQLSTLGYSGSGGGIAYRATDASNSHLAAYNLWAGWGQDSYKLYSNGQVVSSSNADRSDHQYVLSYNSDLGRFTVLLDGNVLDTFITSTLPDTFWFGASSTGQWQQYSTVLLDYVDAWAFNGIRTFGTIEYPYLTKIDRVDANWKVSTPKDADVDFEARMSTDNQTWSMWLPLIDGTPPEDLEGRFLQIRLKASFNGVRDTSAWVRIQDIEVQRHHPVTSVEVRNVDTDGVWMMATGRETWKATVPLQEDMNSIEVRVTDTTGAVNLTSFNQILDTIPPTGTMHILKDRAYTNDLNVTLHLNATDKYGIEYVAVSNAVDMRDAIRYPYKKTIQWTMAGIDGEVACFVRFIDPHGLETEIITDSIFYDSIPPSGEIIIAGGKEYTPTLKVDLELVHSDTRGVRLLELSNHANFTDIRTVDVNESAYANWTLADGDDGPRMVFFRLTDLAGNTRVVNSTIEYHQPQAIGGLSIEGGANITNNPTVQLEIDLPLEVGPRMMQLSNNAAFMDAVWEPVADEMFWILSSNDGYKVIYIRFLDFRQIVSLPVNTSIVLDTTAPQIEVSMDGGSQYTTIELVEVTVDYVDASPAAAMWVSRFYRFNDVEEEAFSSLFSWTVAPREGEHVIYVQVRDMAGNEAIAQDSIHYAAILPKVTLSLPDGDVTGNRDMVTVNVRSQDPYGGIEYALAMDTDPLDDPTWLPDGESFQVSVPATATDGVHIIMVRARNAPGLISELEGIEITLDWTAPNVTLESPLDGSVLPQPGFDVLLLLLAHDPSGIASASYRIDGGPWVDMSKTTLSTIMTMDDFGEYTVEAEVTDGVGNTAEIVSTFTLENSEAQVSNDNSWLFMLVLVAIVAIAGLGYGVLRLRQSGSGLGFFGLKKGEEVEVGTVPGPQSAPKETSMTTQVEGTPQEGSTDPSGQEQVLHTDDDGTEWEMV
jgi:hypothetical protein